MRKRVLAAGTHPSHQHQLFHPGSSTEGRYELCYAGWVDLYLGTPARESPPSSVEAPSPGRVVGDIGSLIIDFDPLPWREGY